MFSVAARSTFFLGGILAYVTLVVERKLDFVSLTKALELSIAK